MAIVSGDDEDWTTNGGPLARQVAINVRAWAQAGTDPRGWHLSDDQAVVTSASTRSPPRRTSTIRREVAGVCGFPRE